MFMNDRCGMWSRHKSPRDFISYAEKYLTRLAFHRLFHMTTLESRLISLEDRIVKLEQGRSTSKHLEDEHVRRARAHAERTGCFSTQWKWVQEDYYRKTLLERATLLKASCGVLSLCKSLLLENKKHNSAAADDSTYPKYVMVILQYASTLNNQKLVNALRQLRPVDQRLDPNQYDLRLASDEDNDRLTGYTHNSVSPFGLIEPDRVFMVMSSSIPCYLYLGGGHVHCKLGLARSDLCRALQPLVADVADPRVEHDIVEE